MNSETLSLGGINVGDALPELKVQVTPKLVIAGALATRDFTRVHHDREHAQSQGLSNIIMNTHTTKGFVGRFITDWAGPGAFLKKISVKLGVPNFAGDTLTLKGQVIEKNAADQTVTVQYAGSNSWGDHATGKVTFMLPGDN